MGVQIEEIEEVKMKALIAESNCEESDSMVMALNLCFPNMELITADTGKECLDMVKDNGPDIVIVGDLADMTDFDVIEQIHSCCDIPVIAVSQSDELTLLKAFAKGADDYMSKPFHQLELVARVRALIRRSKALWDFKDKRGEDKSKRKLNSRAGLAVVTANRANFYEEPRKRERAVRGRNPNQK